MHLKCVIARVVFEDKPPQWGRPAVVVDYRLKCPVCPEGLEETTSKRVIAREQDLDKVPPQIVHELSTLISIARACAGCGVISTLPEKDAKKLAAELAGVVDSAWLRSQIAALGAYKPFHVVHQEAVERGLALATAQQTRQAAPIPQAQEALAS